MVHTHHDDDVERFASYEEQLEQRWQSRQARRRRKAKPKHTPKVSETHILSSVTNETAGLEGGFHPTYTPSRHEEGWILDALRPFYTDGLISDVLAMVKGGKEANVYRCLAAAGHGAPYAAAKVYRPRTLRNLRNDHVYRAGRITLTEDGAVHKNEDRTLRAMHKKTTYGQQVAHQSWLLYEYEALQTLYDAGAAVPEPLGVGPNAILMGYVGDGHSAAPSLHSVSLARPAARRLFDQVVENIALMLRCRLIHGDLSAFNILYWEGEITLIDFPQVVLADRNPAAHSILRRDVARICDYFTRQGVNADAEALAETLWQRYLAPTPEDLAADLSRLLEQADE